MRSQEQVSRYRLVPREDGAAPAGPSIPPRVRRYSLARVSIARRSALGVDRHERLEQVAGLPQS